MSIVKFIVNKVNRIIIIIICILGIQISVIVNLFKLTQEIVGKDCNDTFVAKGIIILIKSVTR